MNTHWKMTLLSGLLAVSLAVPTAGYAAKRAMLVGIADYEKVKRLNGPIEDVDNMVTLAKETWGFEDADILVLKDQQATREAIIAGMRDWLVKGTEKGDEVLFYYSGHGFHIKDDNSDEADGEDETLVPYDTYYANKTYHNMIRDDVFNTFIAELDGRNAHFIFDSCHSGTMTRGLGDGSSSPDRDPAAKTLSVPDDDVQTRGMFSKNLIDKTRGEEAFVQSQATTTVWTAASAYQIAFVDTETRNGSVFTNRFVRGISENLADANRDGEVSHSEMLQFVRKESEDYCNRNQKKCIAGLTPSLEISKDLLASPMMPAQPQQVALVQAPRQQAAAVIPHTQAQPQPQANKVRPVQQTIQHHVSAALPATNSNVLTLSMPTGTKYRLGDEIKMSVKSTATGQLVLLDIDAEGNMTQLFPNKFSIRKNTRNKIKAGQVLDIPSTGWGFKLEAKEPVGKGQVVAMVVEDDIDLATITDGYKDLQVIDEAREYIDNLSQAVNQVWRSDRANRAVVWGKTEVDYEVAR